MMDTSATQTTTSTFGAFEPSPMSPSTSSASLLPTSSSPSASDDRLDVNDAQTAQTSSLLMSVSQELRVGSSNRSGNYSDREEREGHKGLKSLEQVLVEEFAQVDAECAEEERENPTVFSSACAPYNQLKNRYSNNLPNENTRVKLRPDHGIAPPGSDYINANFVKTAGDRVTYIAAQAPLPGTICDFWHMIYEQRVRILVMLTRLQEHGMSKAVRYWPETPGSSRRFGDMDVTLEKETNDRDIVIRRIRVTPSRKGFGGTMTMGESHRVVQLHYQGWPDFGRPRDSRSFRHLLDLIEKIDRRTQNEDAQENPCIATHCSAGLGRTGTLIAAHLALRRLKEGRVRSVSELQVREIVKELRRQRAGMVQTPEQYIFIHEIIDELAADHFRPERPGERSCGDEDEDTSDGEEEASDDDDDNDEGSDDDGSSDDDSSNDGSSDDGSDSDDEDDANDNEHDGTGGSRQGDGTQAHGDGKVAAFNLPLNGDGASSMVVSPLPSPPVSPGARGPLALTAPA